MKNRRNYYRILQVQPDASADVIRAGYRALMLRLKQHPDVGGSDEQASILNEAYRVLADPDLRAAYDRKLGGRIQKHGGNRRPMVTVFCPACAKLLVRKPAPGEHCPTCAAPLHSATGAEGPGKLRRTLDRISKDDQITYCSTWPGTPQTARMIDLSPEGMRFICSEMLVPDMVLKIRSAHFEASARITNVRQEVIDGHRVSAVGVHFLSVIFNDAKGTFLSTSG